MKMKLCDLMRLQHTQRWTIVPTTRPQSVAEHSFNVALIAARIARYSPVSFDLAVLGQAALMHDAPEAVLGDIPTPTKSKMRDIGFEPSQLEFMIQGQMSKLPCHYEFVIKAADILDGIHFLANFGTGARADAVLKQLTEAYDTMIVNAAHGLPESLKTDQFTGNKFAVALSVVREEVLSQEWTE
ncbi:MAG: putative hydrolase of HD superfamily [Podoviridae sp. ctpVR23]|nr:MAG: putative hydrolase of HD superfamily [Podoviridae sp. ctpVR23]